jgi:hypothetical protein
MIATLAFLQVQRRARIEEDAMTTKRAVPAALVVHSPGPALRKVVTIPLEAGEAPPAALRDPAPGYAGDWALLGADREGYVYERFPRVVGP